MVGGAALALDLGRTTARPLALVLLLTTVYLAIGGLMTIFSLNHMIGRGLRGEKAS